MPFSEGLKADFAELEKEILEPMRCRTPETDIYMKTSDSAQTTHIVRTFVSFSDWNLGNLCVLASHEPHKELFGMPCATASGIIGRVRAPTERLSRRWPVRSVPDVSVLLQRFRAYFAEAPATLVYLLALLVTWLTLQSADQRLTHQLIVSASTNVRNMRHDPLQVLIASAFWLGQTAFPWTVVLEFLVIVVAAERWLGTLRWILTFIAGHVGATLITFVGIVYAVDHDLLPARIDRTEDVGYSYGTYAVLMAFTYRLRGPWRYLVAGGFFAYLGYMVWHSRTFTDYGHVCAAAIGFVSYPLSNVIAVRYRRFRIAAQTRRASSESPSSAGSSIETQPAVR